jgi:hypothetical protein
MKRRTTKVGDFHLFYNDFKSAWINCSLEELMGDISKDYIAREISGSGDIVDFRYEDSKKGWEQGF